MWYFYKVYPGLGNRSILGSSAGSTITVDLIHQPSMYDQPSKTFFSI